jgi:tetratricopeptide (TPR) repeat protein
MAFDFEREALIASGIEDEGRVADYLRKLSGIYRQFTSRLSSLHDPVEKARRLFERLWKDRPARYRPKGPYRLGDVIDAQMLKGGQAVGNCLGLTLLYNCLLRKMELDAGALYLKNAFGVGPHVLTLLKVKDGTIDIENILPQGFDYRGHLNDASRTIWGEKDLVADVYCSLGTAFFEAGRPAEALERYDRAIELSPTYETAVLNRAIALQRIDGE